mmetsp:Transcript_35913/g.91786  ORF Transcript_35913/g.91786 Transcript_35913/m.91786 type:complete len:356 (+) Transcript_35913:458-1525(+)
MEGCGLVPLGKLPPLPGRRAFRPPALPGVPPELWLERDRSEDMGLSRPTTGRAASAARAPTAAFPACADAKSVVTSRPAWLSSSSRPPGCFAAQASTSYTIPSIASQGAEPPPSRCACSSLSSTSRSDCGGGGAGGDATPPAAAAALSARSSAISAAISAMRACSVAMSVAICCAAVSARCAVLGRCSESPPAVPAGRPCEPTPSIASTAEKASSSSMLASPSAKLLWLVATLAASSSTSLRLRLSTKISWFMCRTSPTTRRSSLASTGPPSCCSPGASVCASFAANLSVVGPLCRCTSSQGASTAVGPLYRSTRSSTSNAGCLSSWMGRSSCAPPASPSSPASKSTLFWNRQRS